MLSLFGKEGWLDKNTVENGRTEVRFEQSAGGSGVSARREVRIVEGWYLGKSREEVAWEGILAWEFDMEMEEQGISELERGNCRVGVKDSLRDK
jgi:hypothetical protein